MNNNPTISIITPVYNDSKYLDRCIESIINQTFDNFELILVDDGSTDDSGEKCDSWADKDSRIKIIHQKNAGAGAARNVGLTMATGDYIAFVDSDDWIELDMYETLIKLLQDFPMADIAICDTHWTTSSKANIKRSEDPKICVKEQSELLEEFFRIHGEKSNYGIYNKLIRRHIIRDFLFLEGTCYGYVLFLYSLSKSRIHK